MEKRKVSYGFYKPHPLGLVGLILTIVGGIVVFLPSNFTAKVGLYSRLFYMQLVFILIAVVATVVLLYFMSRSGLEKEIVDLKAKVEKEGEK